VRFVTAGSPNGPRLPSWPAYTPSSPSVMVLGDTPKARTLPDDRARRFFEHATN
jgi:carboxylesterase type B